jgi:hypothetical protein
VALPKGVHKVTSRGHEYYYFQAGRGTSAPGPRIKIEHDPQTPEFWAAVMAAQGKSKLPIDEMRIQPTSMRRYQRTQGLQHCPNLMLMSRIRKLQTKGQQPFHRNKLRPRTPL